jgi:hypothetical protein
MTNDFRLVETIARELGSFEVNAIRLSPWNWTSRLAARRTRTGPSEPVAAVSGTGTGAAR